MIKKAEQLLDKNEKLAVRMHDISRKQLLNRDGDATIADRVFSQHVMSDHKSSLGPFYEALSLFIASRIKENGYVSYNDVRQYLIDNGNTVTAAQKILSIDLCRIFREQRLIRVRYTKAHQKRFSIPQGKYHYGTTRLIVPDKGVE